MDTQREISEKRNSGLTRSEVANLLQPIIKLHDIEVKDDRFEFPGLRSSVGMPESELSDKTETTIIFYQDIISISPFKARFEILLLCGKLYIFSTTDNVRTHINTYSGGENIKSEKPVTAQDVAENIWDGLEKSLASVKK
ncbi:hypothetical protein SDC9_82130 [bioreactor metagenome]|uniref:Uncharacterized protein n=1 Tax=bioreactor metagenome TaxID=1076179 RepID=A0A644Z4J8_9ZZZZ|nr:hypothetical protein [Eubacteriales bacterium]